MLSCVMASLGRLLEGGPAVVRLILNLGMNSTVKRMGLVIESDVMDFLLTALL